MSLGLERSAAAFQGSQVHEIASPSKEICAVASGTSSGATGNIRDFTTLVSLCK